MEGRHQLYFACATFGLEVFGQVKVFRGGVENQRERVFEGAVYPHEGGDVPVSE